MILFVNGYTLGCKPFRPYWSSSKKDPDEFINAAKIYFTDEHVEDLSFINGSGDWFGSMAWSRQASGRQYALNNIEAYRKALTPNEKVHLVTHSMGAAFSEGLIEIFVQHGIVIHKVIHFAPSDAKSIKIVASTKHVERVQVNTTGDLVLEKFANPFATEDELRIPGIPQYGKVKWDPWKYHKKHMDYLASKKIPYNLDSHFDTKTFAFVFDWVRDLESLPKPEKIAERKDGKHKRNIYIFPIDQGHGTRFDRIFKFGKYFLFLEEYVAGKYDKYKGPRF